MGAHSSPPANEIWNDTLRMRLLEHAMDAESDDMYTEVQQSFFTETGIWTSYSSFCRAMRHLGTRVHPETGR